MARAGAEAKALILLVTFFPQCVVSMLSMTPPVMASQIALSLGLSPQIAGVYVGLVYAGAILSSSFSASLITRLGPLRTSFACVVTGGAGLALLAVPKQAHQPAATAISSAMPSSSERGAATRSATKPQPRRPATPASWQALSSAPASTRSRLATLVR